MFISKENNFIFIHVPKTGGMSLSKSFEGLGENIVKPGRAAHTTYRMVSKENEDFDKYFTFAFVRNPWDRLFSLYSYMKGIMATPKIRKKNARVNITYNSNNLHLFHTINFKAWLMNSETWGAWDYDQDYPFDQKLQQMYFISDENGNIGVDYVAKFEKFQEDFDYICDKVGLNNVKLFYTNRSKHKDYKRVYDKEMIDFVSEFHKDDIEKFGYDFE